MTSDDALLWARKQVASQYRGSSTLTAAILSGKHDDQSPVHDYAAAYRAGHAAGQSDAEARMTQLEAALRFYALPGIWRTTTMYMSGPAKTQAELDAGEKARAALEGK